MGWVPNYENFVGHCELRLNQSLRREARDNWIRKRCLVHQGLERRVDTVATGATKPNAPQAIVMVNLKDSETTTRPSMEDVEDPQVRRSSFKSSHKSDIWGANIAQEEEPEESANVSAANEELNSLKATILRVKQEVDAAKEKLLAAITEKTSLKFELKQMEAASNDLSGGEGSDGIPRESLEHAYLELLSKYNLERSRMAQYGHRIRHLQNKLIYLNEQQKDHIKLQEKHQSGALAIIKLQERVAKIEKYAASMKEESEVLQAMERKLTHPSGPINPQSTVQTDTYKKALKLNFKLHKKIRDLKILQQRTKERFSEMQVPPDKDNITETSGTRVGFRKEDRELEIAIRALKLKKRLDALHKEFAYAKNSTSN